MGVVAAVTGAVISVTTVLESVAVVGAVVGAVGAVTGNKTLGMIGLGLGLVGGVGALATSALGAGSAAIAALRLVRLEMPQRALLPLLVAPQTWLVGRLRLWMRPRLLPIQRHP